MILFYILTITALGGFGIYFLFFKENNDWIQSLALQYIILYNEKYVEYSMVFKEYYDNYKMVKMVADIFSILYKVIYTLCSSVYYMVCFGELPLNEDCIYIEYYIQTHLNKYKNNTNKNAPFMFIIYNGFENYDTLHTTEKIENPNYTLKKEETYNSLYSNAFIREVGILQREINGEHVNDVEQMPIITNIENAVYIIREQQEYNASMKNNMDCLAILKIDKNVIIRVLRNNAVPKIPTSNEIINSKPSRVKFLAIEYLHPELNKSIFLEMNPFHLVENNELFSWCYIRREIYKIPFFIRPPFDYRYSIKLIDGMANEITLTSTQYVKLSKFKYEIIG